MMHVTKQQAELPYARNGRLETHIGMSIHADENGTEAEKALAKGQGTVDSDPRRHGSRERSPWC